MKIVLKYSSVTPRIVTREGRAASNAKRDTRHATCDTRHATRDMRHATRGVQEVLSSSLLTSAIGHEARRTTLAL